MSDFQDRNRQDQSTSAAVAETARNKASEGAGLVGDHAAEVAGTAKEQASGVGHEATAQARDLVGEVRDQLQDQARAQTRRLAENVRRLADELHDMSANGKSDSTAAHVVGQIADGGHQMASRLERRGPDGLVSDLQDFARRKPGVFLAGAALAGFVAARAGKGVSAAGSTAAPDAGVSPAQGGSATPRPGGSAAPCPDESGRRPVPPSPAGLT